MYETERRYDIDWLRVIAIGLLLIYHIAIVFQPWGVLIGFIQSDDSLEWLWTPMAMLNVWRIPLLFFVSGMGVCFAMRKRNGKQLLIERSKRILVPLVFGVFFIAPLHIFIWQKFYNQDIKYLPTQGHLWFLTNIYVYVLVLLPLFIYLKNNENGKLMKILHQLFKTPLGLLFIAFAFILEAIIVNPEPYELYATTLHGFVLGLLAFLLGFISILTGKLFWHHLLNLKWVILTLAVSLFTFRLLFFELKAPNFLMATESINWIYVVFGFAQTYLNKPGKTLSYLSQGAYPIYILHMLFLFLGSVFILPLAVSAILKFILIVVFTFAGSILSYEFIIRRIKLVRPLFGLKNRL